MPHPKEWGSASPNFLGPSYVRPNGLTYSDEIWYSWYGNTRGQGAFVVGQARPHLSDGTSCKHESTNITLDSCP